MFVRTASKRFPYLEWKRDFEDGGVEYLGEDQSSVYAECSQHRLPNNFAVYLKLRSVCRCLFSI